MTDRPRALLINTAFLGDVVFTLPVVENLGRAGYAVDLLTRPGYGQLAAGLPGFGAALDFDKRGAMAGAGATLALGRALRRRAYDLVVGAHPSIRSGILARLSGAPIRVGWGPFGYTHRVGRGPVFGDDALQLLEHIGISASTRRPRLADLAGDLRGGAAEPGTVALLPGARWATKRWPVAHWIALGQALRRAGHPVWAAGGPDDAALCRQMFEAGAAEGVRHEAALRPLAAWLATCAAAVGGDSGLAHLAHAAGTPTVLLFGPTAAERHAPHPDRVALAVDDLACRPCSPHGPARCPLGHHRCMRDLSPEHALDGLQRLGLGPP